MNFDSRDFLALANKLVADEPEGSSELVDSKTRAAIGRAYYAAYHVTLEYAKTCFGFIQKNDNSSVHLELIRALRDKSSMRGNLINKLNQLRRNRGQADYDMSLKPAQLEEMKKYFLANTSDVISGFTIGSKSP